MTADKPTIKDINFSIKGGLWQHSLDIVVQEKVQF